MYFISLKKICVGCFFKYNAQRLKTSMVEWKLWTLEERRLKLVSQICHVLFLISVDFSSLTWKIKKITSILEVWHKD